MPSKDPILRFEDILANVERANVERANVERANVERIEEHTAGMHGEAAFKENHLVYDVVERCLERISEAAHKLGATAEDPVRGFRGPTFAGWKMSCGTNTTGWRPCACGTWFRIICRP